METGHHTYNKSSHFKTGRTRDLVHTGIINIRFLVVEKISLPTYLRFLSFVLLEDLSFCFPSKVGSGVRDSVQAVLYLSYLIGFQREGSTHGRMPPKSVWDVLIISVIEVPTRI